MTPKIVKGIDSSISYIAVGYDHSIALTSDGKIWTWGGNKYSQLGHSFESDNVLVPVEIAMKKVYAVGAAASKYHSAIFTNTGAIYTWGTNTGQLGISI